MPPRAFHSEVPLGVLGGVSRILRSVRWPSAHQRQRARPFPPFLLLAAITSCWRARRAGSGACDDDLGADQGARRPRSVVASMPAPSRAHFLLMWRLLACCRWPPRAGAGGAGHASRCHTFSGACSARAAPDRDASMLTCALLCARSGRGLIQVVVLCLQRGVVRQQQQLPPPPRPTRRRGPPGHAPPGPPRPWPSPSWRRG